MSPITETRITTRCPSCGNTTLFIGSGGHLTCSWLKCPSPSVERTVAELTAALIEAREFIGREYDIQAMRLGYWPTVKPLVDRIDAVLKGAA